ncbi:MAG: DUF2326 domain-containing protein [Candidatus Electronema sp. V4]|uniref:DUF2326 domain-containing protein n=1 Tax=Candidatus Electronema sp. V4 TaxID=3454756 RepID=UPI0040559B2D
MFLKKIYSEPSGLFRSGKPDNPNTIIFKDGFNFIFGKKDNSKNNKEPLNGIGKSTLADLIDFCLLSDFSSKNPRLYKEKGRMNGYKIVLEFEVNHIDYIIKRSSDKSDVELGTIHRVEEFSLKDARTNLFKIIFNNYEYKGILNEKWYRSLMSFFLKIHKKRRSEFSDPINFLTQNNRLSEINQFHFFLLGIDNTLICKNFELQKDVKNRNAAISQVKKIVEKNYGISIREIDSQLSKLRNDIKKTRSAIDAFKLAEQFKDVELKLNELTESIKDLSEKNFWMGKKIKSYKDSYEVKDNISDNKIKCIEKLYSELNPELGGLIKKSLKEAVSFRIKLSHSREEFLKDEIKQLEEKIRINEEKINKLDAQRKKLFLLLKSKDAFTDLTQAFYYLGEQEKELSDLEGKIKTYRDLESEKLLYKEQDAKIGLDINSFIENIQPEIDKFENLFSEIYNRIYPESASSGFSITPNYYGSDKISINISFDKDESKGWNKGRTLIYDISIMLNSIHKNIKIPRFLIHDGIFDGMDKSQFVEIYHYVQNLQKEGTKFQYIVTMIEEGELRGNFGDTDELTVEKIAEQSIAVFTPSQKIWID